MAETKNDALVALDLFVDTYGAKYEKALDCLTRDRDVLLAFYDFPAEHWRHLRTTTRSRARCHGTARGDWKDTPSRKVTMPGVSPSGSNEITNRPQSSNVLFC